MKKIGVNKNIEKKFENPQEEIEYLRQQIQQREKQIEKGRQIPDREQVISETIQEYKQNRPDEILNKGHVIPENIRNEINLKLSPEEHDDKISELVEIIQQKGISNAIDIVDKMNDAHVEDDFHRFLVQYLREGYTAKGHNEKSKIAKTLNRALFEVILPDRGADQNQQQDLQQLISMMEQFYSGMFSIESDNKDDYLTLEIANALGSRQFIFYISVSLGKKQLFEKQILSFFQNAQIIEQRNDFNIFNQKGFSVGAYAKLKNTAAKPLRTYDEFQNDPLRVLLNVFSKLDQAGEGAAVQIIFKPSGGEFYEKNYAKALSRLEKGEPAGDELYMSNTKTDKIINTVSGLFNSGFSKKKENENKPVQIDSSLIELVKKKISKPIVSTNIRVVASSQTEAQANSILSDIKSAFNQFNNPVSNEIEFVNLKKSNLKNLFKQFSFREYSPSIEIPLNIAELSTIIHLPPEKVSISSQLKSSNFATAPAPIELPTEGTLLGINNHQNQETEIYISEQDRMRHFYTIGQTGTGKTNFLKTQIIQDIKNGEGVCMIDPHGNDIQDVLANVPPDRYDDIIYFDPAYIQKPMALNMLEYNHDYPEQKSFVIDELFNIFMKLYGSNPEAMGPMFEQYFRNATALVVEDPETGSTLLDVSRVMADENYRKLKLSRCNNPVVKQFWEEIAQKAGGEASLANIVPYITSKFDVFLANEIMRPIISQEKSAFNFREVMDQKKILLVNLSKGRLGDKNSHLIGLIIVGKILMAALSRTDNLKGDLAPFYLYVDEFQNVTTDSIATILSEARKYKLSLNIAHQFIDQLDEKISDAVFGNVGSMAVFRVGTEDAEFFERQFKPTFSASDIMNIENFNFYAKILANGVPVEPFNIKALPAPSGDLDKLESLKQLSYMKYGRDRAEVEKEIMKKYQKKEEEKLESDPFSKLNVLKHD